MGSKPGATKPHTFVRQNGSDIAGFPLDSVAPVAPAGASD
jgi:hypothetical protein